MTPPPPLPPPPRPSVPGARPGGGFWAALRGIGRAFNVVRLVLLNLVFFSVLLLVLLLIGGGMAGNRMAHTVRSNSVLVLQPKGELVEQYSIEPMQRALATLSGDPPRQVQLRDLIGAIDAATADKRITRILLLPGELNGGGFAALREVGAALDRFRATHRPVVVWGVNLDQGQYYLAAHADRILLDPQGGVMITGLANYRLFYKNLLDKLGVDVHLFRVGQFKSAAEPYILDHASAASKQADAFWMGGLWDGYIEELARLRKLSPAAVRADIDQLPTRIAGTGGDLARLALDEHLIDGTATRAQLEQMMRDAGVPAGERGQGFRQVGMSRFLAGQDRTSGILQPGVAIVVAEGEIAGGKQPNGSIGGESTAALIRAARADRRTRALVLRVNSPGGEVYAAEQIRREVALTRQAGIPVVVSMGNMAASGGYWISMNADRIFAEPDTITGSIGIFGMYYTVPGALAKLGIQSDGVGTSPMAGAFDVTRPLDPHTGAVIQAIIDKGYRDFVGGVAKARGRSFESINTIAQGRVWTGKQALERGLVDQLGGLREAVADAASRARLGDDHGVRYVEKPLGGLEAFLLGMKQNAMVEFAQGYGVHLPSWLGQLPRLAPELQLLRSARAGRPNVYAYCFCNPY